MSTRMFKTISSRTLQRKIVQINKICFSTAAEPVQRIDNFRTLEHSPSNHTKDHASKFYQIPSEVKKRVFSHGGFPKSFETHVKTFAENCVMIREPALDIITCMKNLDYSKPIVKFLIYGKQGTGKSISLAHVLHYGHEAGFLLVHVPWVGSWMRRCKEYCNSTTKEGNIDLPMDAAAWLIHFKVQNQQILSTLHVSKDYHWSKREITPKSATILELVEHGINRVKYASDCIVILAEEIKRLSSEGKCKTLVAIDGFNAFFYPHIRVFTEKKEPVFPGKVTLTEAFLNLTKHDWHNGVAVLTVDELAIPKEAHISHLPLYLLGKEGFEHIDPFVPVPVSEYDKKELASVMDYYRERKWIQTEPEHDEELALISNYNPYGLMLTCAPL